MISVILVNYHSARLAINAVASVIDQTDIEKPEIIVVDNSTAESEHALMKTHLPDAVTYLINQHNAGFARACNQAFACANGELILLLNPDARLLPNALSLLSDYLKKHPDAGAVGPRAYWDDDRRYLMPPSTFPSVAGLYKEAISRLHPYLADYSSLDFRKKALRFWTCTAPIAVAALSGGHVLLRRDAVIQSGGLFDERFFMYWEDSDLMHRLKKTGYRLYMEPNAGCVHYYEHAPAKDKRIAQGWPAYRQKHFAHTKSFRLVNWLGQHLPSAAAADIEPLSCHDDKLIVPVPAGLRNGWLLEIGTRPQLLPAIGLFGNGPTVEVSTLLFKRLREKTYYARLSAPNSRPDLVYYWQWQGYSTEAH
ncbi:Glycosyltransferase, GT2 family [Nitrosomonas sp. Nm51]|uniref:glycosyltransferase family 2 protein n=1 Tax=Nitrosomonas sp. Nm51 TaxID=133720 RepID=UPI0008C7E347|nr:glycosyltransferase family 2 protein [Nitrosomonas sp. Nm51]SER26269.1 Glycosyltransferase, GT2 family [Nitrosomonas sp. Nm51]